MASQPGGLVNRILAPSFLDGPGSRLVVFMQGCDLSCGHCHNPETWRACAGCGQCLPCPEGALEAAQGGLRHHPGRCRSCDRCLDACPNHASPRAQVLTMEQLLEQVRPWIPYLDGITFSGGECTLQWEFLLACAPRLRELGLPVLLDTNGNMPPAVLEALLPEVDGLLFDVKALDPQAHRDLTGCGNERILANLARAAGAGKVAEVRTVLIPGVTDEPETVLAVARLVASLGADLPLRLSPFRPQGARGPWAQVAALAPERFRELCDGAEAVLGERLKRASATG